MSESLSRRFVERDYRYRDRSPYSNDRDDRVSTRRSRERSGSSHGRYRSPDRDKDYREKYRRDDYPSGRYRDDRRDRDRSRSPDSRDRDHRRRSRSPRYRRSSDRDDARGRETSYLSQQPNNTVLIRNLPLECTEEDIRNEIDVFGAPIKEIRVVRKRSQGGAAPPRGLAFLEFLKLEDAQRWMDQSQGKLRLREQWLTMIYNDTQYQRPPPLPDWYCFGCGLKNFGRRVDCYRCGMPKSASEKAKTDQSVHQISIRPTKYLLFRDLEPLTTDESLYAALLPVSPVQLHRLFISRDPVLQVSNGYAYLEVGSEQEAITLKEMLINTDFVVDNKKVVVHFAKSYGDVPVTIRNSPPRLYDDRPPKFSRREAAQEDFSHNPLVSKAGRNGAEDPQQRADRIREQAVLAAAAAARKQQEQAQIILAHQQQQGLIPTPAPPAAAPPVVQQTVNVNGNIYPVFPIPDTSKYVFDAGSGYYYDPSTTLYYDANTHYYYNSQTRQYLYWDGSHSTYLPVTVQQQSAMEAQHSQASQAPAPSGPMTAQSAETPGKKPDKVQMAKKIREDMERWTKTVNSSKKPDARPPTKEDYPEPAGQELLGSAVPDFSSMDPSRNAAFAAMEKRPALFNDSQYRVPQPDNEFKKVLLDPNPQTALTGLDTAGSSDPPAAASSAPVNPSSSYASNGTAEQKRDDEEFQMTDWKKLACLLCKRQFKDKETLLKHQKFSDLHKSNMEVHMKSKLTVEELEALEKEESGGQLSTYRDRAKERRQKHGISAPPLTARDARPSPPPAATVNEPISSTNVGNKLMQAMGWKEGEGLGREKQGITAPISATGRETTAGLGAVEYKRDPNLSYAENARRAFLARMTNNPI